jgi:aspartyl protease family protein
MKNGLPAVFGLVIIGVLLLGLLLWRFPYVLSSDDNLAHIIWTVLLLCALIPAAIHHVGSSPALKYGAAWIGIFLVILIGYSYQEELGGVVNKIKGNVMPFSATQHEDGSVSFMRAKNGHFLIEAFVNTVPIQFMVDTGATKIALTIPDAKRLGIDGENLTYNEPMHTANGLTFGASIRLAEIKVGTLVIYDVPASVCQNLSEPSLLGMSFLQKLTGFKIEGDYLTLEAPTSSLVKMY